MDDELQVSSISAVYSQLLRQQERVLHHLRSVKEDLDTSTTRALLDQLRGESDGDVEDAVSHVLAVIEDALRAAQHCHAEIQRELLAPARGSERIGPENLPPRLERFLAERQDTPGFTYEIHQDLVRGWIIRWKEYSKEGVVRGSGQFYERPYAWLNG
jgi:hypothetical protein